MPLFSLTASDTLVLSESVQRGALIQDTIANAQDGFPDAVGHGVVSTTGQLDIFTTEADDPTEIGAWSGDSLGYYTAWMKLVIPVDAQVHIQVADVTNVTDTVMWLYDAPPTASSTFVQQNDDDPDLGLWSVIDAFITAGTYYLCVTPFDGALWDNSEGGQLSILVRWDHTPTIADFSMDAIIRRTWLVPFEPSAASIDWIATNPDSVNNAASLFLDVPGGVQDGDLLVAMVSWDKQASTSAFMTIPTAQWTHARTNSLTNNDQALSTFYSRYATGDQTSALEFKTWVPINTPFSTAKAGGIAILRGATRLEWTGDRHDNTYAAAGKATAYLQPSNGDPLFGANRSFLGVWGGAAAGTTTWVLVNVADPVSEVILNATASDFASASAQIWLGEEYTYIDERYAVSRDSGNNAKAEVQLTSLFILHAPTLQITLASVIQPGGLIPMDAVIQAATHTTHPRTGPHYGVNVDTSVVISATLGAMSAGTDLHTVLRDLDGLITNLENKT